VSRKKKPRRGAPFSAIAPWLILTVSLAVIGFACTRTPPSSHTTPAPVPGATVMPATRAPETPAPAAASPSPSALPPTPQPSPAPSPKAVATAAATPTPEPQATVHPAYKGLGPKLALIIDDCGQWPATERGFIALPVTLTLSVLPDVRFNHTIEREAIDGNKGVMLHLPMETLSGLNPGPGKITTEMDDSTIAAQVEHDLQDVELARGVNNHEGSRATADRRVMNDLMTVLARRDRFFIDSRTNRASVAEAIASERGVATAGRDVFLDNRADVAYTEGQLRLAVQIAQRDGSAIAIGHPRPTTLQAVRAMIPELQADGIHFVLAADLTH
jgi:polysaccharide deacetylase 2 family uncharacterized protein YibQ